MPKRTKNDKDDSPKRRKLNDGKPNLTNGKTNGNNGKSTNGSNGNKTPQKIIEKIDFLTDDNDLLKTFHEKNNITVEGSITNFAPIESFDESYFPEVLLRTTKNFSKPTPIQSQCWPILLSKRDTIGIAQTGSGKTLAFGLPLMKHVLSVKNNRKTVNPRVLILSPTRELSVQTDNVLSVIGKNCGLKVLCIYGGVSIQPQIKALEEGVHILVATPGRLIDLHDQGKLDLSEVEYFVLDEADRMLDMGFEKDMRRILGFLPPKHLTAMFTATWPYAIQKLALDYLNQPIKITIGSPDLAANHNITQIVEVIEDEKKNGRLLELLKKYHASGKNRILIFVLKIVEVSKVYNLLKNRWEVQTLCSRQSQNSRQTALNAFINGSAPLLIATDVAARGLDIPNVEYVINYSYPLETEQYVHRIGRTGRAGARGISHTFFTKFDKKLAGELINIMIEAKQEIPAELLDFDRTVRRKPLEKQIKIGKIDIQQSTSVILGSDSDEE